MDKDGRGLETKAAWAAGAVSLVALAVALRWSTYIVGGSDSYCYVSQARFWLDGSLFAPQPVGFTPPWPDAALSLTPTGYIPSPTIPGAIAPLCPAGLSLTMAALEGVGGSGAAFLVVPILGALSVWLTYRLGLALAGPAAGLLAAILVACSPIVLHQAVQPMSDVPAMAWWLAAIVLLSSPGRGLRWRSWGRACAAGLAVSAAVLTRPNLAPLAGVLGLFLLARPHAGHGGRARLAGFAAFSAGVLPGAVAVAWIQHALYGSPFSSGYGALDQLFAWSHVVPNLRRFPAWLLSTHTPAVCLALATPLAVRGRPPAAWLALLCLGFSAAVLASYVAYIPYDDWWYLRFLLPAVPPVLALSAATLTALGARLPQRLRAPGWAACATALAIFFVHTAEAKGVFRLRSFESRFRTAGRYVAATLPKDAVVLSVWESGSVRHYGGRLSVLFDEIEPEWLDRAVAFLEAQGRPPYLLLETWEEPAFRVRFDGHSRFGALDWPPMAEIGTEVRLYNPADRDRYFAGEATPRERVWPDGRGQRRR